jgi:hypothetical protein
MHFDAYYSSCNVLQQAWVVIVKVGMVTWKAINSIRFTPEPSFKDIIDQVFKAEWCHLNIFGEDGAAMVWRFLPLLYFLNHQLSSGELKAEGYSFLYSGHQDLARKGVALALSLSVANSLLAWLAVSPCLMWAQLQLEKGLKLWVVVCYAPIDYSGDQPKDAFYGAFFSVVVAIPACDLVLYLGDFNGQVESNACRWEGVLGGFSLPSTTAPPPQKSLKKRREGK